MISNVWLWVSRCVCLFASIFQSHKYSVHHIFGLVACGCSSSFSGGLAIGLCYVSLTSGLWMTSCFFPFWALLHRLCKYTALAQVTHQGAARVWDTILQCFLVNFKFSGFKERNEKLLSRNVHLLVSQVAMVRC